MVPGLSSAYALQASTLLTRHSNNINMAAGISVQCPSYDHLLTYMPVETGSRCGREERKSLLVVTDALGRIRHALDLLTTTGSPYNGSVTGVAVSAYHAIRRPSVWVCGRDGNMAQHKWKIFKFNLNDVRDGVSPLAPVNAWDVPFMSNSPNSYERCTLTFKPPRTTDYTALRSQSELWVVGLTATVSPGVARAYLLTSDGDIRSESKTLLHGKHVTGLSFFYNMFLDPHVMVARCPTPEMGRRGRKNTGCRMEFHSYAACSGRFGRSCLVRLQTSSNLPRGGMMNTPGSTRPTTSAATSLSQANTVERTLKNSFPIPAGLGSVAHDSSLAPVEGRFFTAAFVGLTAEHIDATQQNGGPPEDRIFMVRQPIMQTGWDKSQDAVVFKTFGFDLIGAVCLRYNIRAGLCNTNPYPFGRHQLLQPLGSSGSRSTRRPNTGRTTMSGGRSDSGRSHRTSAGRRKLAELDSQGHRVRRARAFMHDGAMLDVMDPPFSGFPDEYERGDQDPDQVLGTAADRPVPLQRGGLTSSPYRGASGLPDDDTRLRAMMPECTRWPGCILGGIDKAQDPVEPNCLNELTNILRWLSDLPSMQYNFFFLIPVVFIPITGGISLGVRFDLDFKIKLCMLSRSFGLAVIPSVALKVYDAIGSETIHSSLYCIPSMITPHSHYDQPYPRLTA